MDEDGFDQFLPDELKAWFESQREKSGFGFGWYILEDGRIKRVGFLEGAMWFGNFEKRKVDWTAISDDVYVSTVFLGLDHNFHGEGLPVLFETMVFGGEYNQRGWRYSTMGEAKKGHWQIVDCIKAGEPPRVDFGERPFIEEFLEMFKDVMEEDKKNEIY